MQKRLDEGERKPSVDCQVVKEGLPGREGGLGEREARGGEPERDAQGRFPPAFWNFGVKFTVATGASNMNFGTYETMAVASVVASFMRGKLESRKGGKVAVSGVFKFVRDVMKEVGPLVEKALA